MVYSEIFEDVYKIDIGRNATENDSLIANADQRSLWFHLSGQPSPHGILTNIAEPGVYSKNAIYHCGQLVKSYSKAKDLHKIKVDCIEITHVKRTGKAGLVNLMKKPKIIVV